MQTQNKTMTPDFSGQNIYVGIDTYFKTWMVSIYSDEFELKRFGQEPNVYRLENYLHKHYPNANLKLAMNPGSVAFGYNVLLLKKEYTVI